MRVLLSVVGIGLGHATRSEAVYKELLKVGAKVKVMTWGPAYDYYKKSKIPAGKIAGYEFKGDQYAFSMFFNTLDVFKDPNKVKREYLLFANQADEFKPDVVISDSDPNALFYARRRKIPNFVISNLITTMDNYEKIPKEFRTRDLMLQNFMLKRLMDYIESRTNRILVPSFESKIRYKENVKYTDLIIRKKPSELPSEKQIREKIGIDREFYFVSIGGSDIEKYLLQILLRTLPKFEDKYFVVSSNYEYKKITEEKNMKIFPFITNALEYMKVAKGIIAPAGHSTISEAICYRKPMLAIPVKNHIEQMVNAALLKKEGFGDACFFGQKANASILKLCIEDFFKKEEKMKIKLDSFKFHGKGAEQIARSVLLAK